MADNPKPVELPPVGLYQHYKSSTLHELFNYATMQPSGEYLVLYRPAGMPRAISASTIAEFTAAVERDGEQVPRFSLVRKDDDNAI